MACCVGNICTENYQNVIIGFQVTVENVGDVLLRLSVVVNLYLSAGFPVTLISKETKMLTSLLRQACMSPSPI